MWFDYPPTVPDANAPIIYMADKTNPTVLQQNTAHKLGVCRYVTNAQTTIYPVFDAVNYIGEYLSDKVDYSQDSHDNAHVRILQEPQHGMLEPMETTRSNRYRYRYTPAIITTTAQYENDQYYYGRESFVVEASAWGITIQIHYTLGVEVGEQESYVDADGVVKTVPAFYEYCPYGEHWKISTLSPENSIGLTNWYASTSLQARLSRAKQKKGAPLAQLGTSEANLNAKRVSHLMLGFASSLQPGRAEGSGYGQKLLGVPCHDFCLDRVVRNIHRDGGNRT
jgi:hypothetical protein